MRCDKARAELTALIDEELGRFETWRVRRHVAGCRECAVELESLQGLDGNLRESDLLGMTSPLPSIPASSLVRPRLLRPTLIGGLAACVIGIVVFIASLNGGQPKGNDWAGTVARKKIPDRNSASYLFAEKRLRPSLESDRVQPLIARKETHQAGHDFTPDNEDFDKSPGAPSPQDSAIPSKETAQQFALKNRKPALTTGLPVLQAALPRADVQYLNTDPTVTMAWWASLHPSALSVLQKRLDQTIRQGDSFVTVSFPRVAGNSPKSLAAAAAVYRQEKEIIDPRLARTVDLRVKAMAFSDLCRQLKQDTGIEFSANRGVADDKVTIFCRRKPLRDIMRQINRLFGFSWRRTGDPGQYQYELAQELRSQIMEEELRNRDRDEALMALDREMERWRKYANLEPGDLKERADKTEDKEEKRDLYDLMNSRLALNRLYFGFSPEQLTALRDGKELTFSSEPEQGELPLSAQSAKWGTSSFEETIIPGKPVTATFKLDKSELGQYTLMGHFYAHVKVGENGYSVHGHGAYMAVGKSPSAQDTKNAVVNARMADDPAFQGRVDIKPVASCKYDRGEYANFTSTDSGPKVTIADVLEKVYKETGKDIIADHFTRLYAPDAVTAKDMRLYAALNHLCDTMKLRWSQEEGWIRARSLTFFHDRLKEIPDRLLEKWSASRRKNGMVTLDDLVEIGQLSDAQLDSEPINVGAMACYDLKEWGFGAMKEIRGHWRFLGRLSAASRQAAFSEKGLAYATLPLSQRQQMVVLAFGQYIDRIQPGYDDLNGATLRVRIRKHDAPAQPDDHHSFPYNANPVQFIYANRDHWITIQGPFNGFSHLPR